MRARRRPRRRRPAPVRRPSRRRRQARGSGSGSGTGTAAATVSSAGCRHRHRVRPRPPVPVGARATLGRARRLVAVRDDRRRTEGALRPGLRRAPPCAVGVGTAASGACPSPRAAPARGCPAGWRARATRRSGPSPRRGRRAGRRGRGSSSRSIRWTSGGGRSRGAATARRSSQVRCGRGGHHDLVPVRHIAPASGHTRVRYVDRAVDRRSPSPLCIGMLVVAHRIEPHWVSKDGRRFLTTSEQVDRSATSSAAARRSAALHRRRRPGRAAPAGRRCARPASSSGSRPSRRDRRAGQALYVLRPVPAAADGSLLVLRVPASSELVGLLDALGTDADRRPTPATTSALRHLIHELGDRAGRAGRG